MHSRLLKKQKLCDDCLARQPRAKTVFVRASDPAECWLCGGVVSRVGEIADKVMQKFESLGAEFQTFLIGTRIPKGIETREEELWEAVGFEGAEALKVQLNREIGKALERKYGKYRYDPDPEVRAIYDVTTGNVEISITPLYIYGRYRKLKTMRQTKKAGSEEESIEALIEPAFLGATGGRKAVLHGHGREDIDVLMLGTGRPFIVEVQEPRKRKVNFEALRSELNKTLKGKIEISSLKWAKVGDVERLKRARFDKTYEALIETKGKIKREDLKKLKPVLLMQRTPTRVLQRRADLTRKRRVKGLETRFIDNHHAALTITAEAGTYIKEFINGDNGRTVPSVSSVLGTPTTCKELKVLKVHSEWYEDFW